MNFFKFNKVKLLGLALLALLSVPSFFIPEITHMASAQSNTCSVSLYFQINDMSGKKITSFPNKDARFVLYAKYSDLKNMSKCEAGAFGLGLPKHRFRQVFADGSYEFIGPEEALNYVSTDGSPVEKSLSWQLSGLKDAKTKNYVQNGGVVQLESYLATADGKQITKSSTVTLAVGNEPSQGFDNNRNGQVTEAQNKDRGLVPCGRDSALSPTGGTAGPRPNDTCTVYNFFELFVRVINYLLLISGFFATFQIVRASFSMVLSQGDGEATKKAKNALIYSIMGFVFASMAFVIINTVVVGILGLRDSDNILKDPAGYIRGN